MTRALWLIGVPLGALVAWQALGDAALQYDSQWALNWGAGFLRGELPVHDTLGAPTPHPLTTFVGAVAQLLVGDSADDVLRAFAFLGYAALVIGTGLLAAAAFSRWAALPAAAAVATCVPALETTPTAFMDASAAGLVVIAAWLAVSAPERPARPLIALAFAGLLRPEPWGLAAVWWLWNARGRAWPERLRLAALAAIAPVIWMTYDLVITGDPLDSLTRTRSGAEAARRTTGLENGPTEFANHVQDALGKPVIAAAAIGGAATLAALWGRPAPFARLRRPGQPLVLALGALLVLAFLVLAAAGLSLLARYLIAPEAVLCVLAGAGFTGWLHVRGTVRWLWAPVAVIFAGYAINTVSSHLDGVRSTLDFYRAERRTVLALDAFAARSEVRSAIRACEVLAAPAIGVRAYLSYDLDRAPQKVAIAPDPPRGPKSAVWVVPASPEGARRFHVPLRDPQIRRQPEGFRRVATSRDWNAYARGC